MGFTGVSSFASSKPIVKLGAIQFSCWESMEETDKTLNDNLEEFYDEYDAIVWLVIVGIVLVVVGCILCACYLQQSVSKIRRMEFDKEIAGYQQQIKNMEDRGMGVS